MAIRDRETAGPPLLERFHGLRVRTPHLSLSGGPSPVTRLGHLSNRLGTDIWVKNDGLYGTMYGGNKPRKLEFVLADAQRRGGCTIITMGAIGTNHGLATAIYGSHAGFRVALLLSYEEPQEETVQHVLRLAKAGAELHYMRSYARTALVAPYYIGRYWMQDGKAPYRLGAGGSSVHGVLGYVNAGLELADQIRGGELPEPRTIFLPVGTGGTLAGLLLGLRLAGLDSEVIGVVITRAPTAWKPAVLRMARAAASLIASKSGESSVTATQLSGLQMTRDWLGPGFGRASEEGDAAAKLATEEEGLDLEPVYTAKTLAALCSIVRSGRPHGPVLYWHTYNAIALPPVEPRADLIARVPGDLRRLLGL
jgi:D-cysteine desulfhydrase